MRIYLKSQLFFITCAFLVFSALSSPPAYARSNRSPVNGVCGSANGTIVSKAPTTKLCNTGTASSVTGKGPWAWTCAGSNGGATASCAAGHTASASGSSITGTGTLYDSGGNAWTLSGGVVYENGALAGYSSGVVELIYINKLIYQENNQGGWWDWVGGTWVATTNPTASANASCTDPTGASHASGSTYTLTLSTTVGSIAATTAQCPYGGTQATTTTVTQTYLCTNGAAAAQGAPVSTVMDTGNPVCNAAAPVNGACGPSNGVTVSAAPTTGLCLTGTASSVTGAGPWAWTCAGSNGGVTASCEATGQCSAGTRDWRVWPFSSTSPWNYPIGSGAQYATVPNLSGLPAGITTNQWTSSVAVAADTDPMVSVLTNEQYPATNWSYLDDGGVQCGASGSAEETFLGESINASGASMNTWSTTPISSYVPSSQNFEETIYLPTGACPSPDSDGLMAVFQPNGWVLDTYATVVLANGDIVGQEVSSFIDATNDGTGYWNGRRASMLPSFAGLIRTGEFASGTIPHALAVTMSPTILTNQALWPANAYDTNSGYSGTLPMGSLLAIPPSVNINNLGLSPLGLVMARAAQNYGVYVVDRGGAGVTFQVQENDPDVATWAQAGSDATTIIKNLQWVTNNSSTNVGGGGTLRAPLAPALAGSSCP